MASTNHKGCISSINWEIFEPDLLCVSEELLTCDLDANDYAILLNSKLEILLDKHAPVKKRSDRVGQHPNNQLSNEAIEAKKCCRRMERLYRRKGTGAAKKKNRQRKQPSWPSSTPRRLPSRRSSTLMPIHVPCGVHLIEFCIVARNSTTLMLSANLSSLRSIPFSSRKSPTFINQSPTPSLHRPPHPFHPGSSQARPSQHSRLSRRQKS